MRVRLLAAWLALGMSVAVGCGSGSGPSSSTGGGNTGGGGTGTGGTSGDPVCAAQSPPGASGGANYPFPQHRLSNNCGYPTNCNDADVMMSWATYKSKMIVSAGGSQLRVQRDTNNNDTVSEGIAYGMLMAVYLHDKTTFDGLWAYAQAHLRSDTRLMNWHLTASGAIDNSAGDGSHNATDADEDIAFALVMADKQWGGYASAATAMINAILMHEVESGSNVLKPGDNFGGSSETNPSYFAPAYYRVFAQVTGNSRWMQVVDTSYTVLEACAHDQTGLVPDWCSAAGAATRSSNYTYDATRTPFRIAQDACWNNEPRATAYLTRVASFFNGIGPTAIKDGYRLDGTVTGQYISAAFEGPAGTGAMPSGATYAPFLRQIYARLITTARTGTASGYNYYNASWAVLSLMMMTGNFVNFAGL